MTVCAKILKRAQLANDNRMSQMYIRRRRIDAKFDAQWLAGFRRVFELGAKFALANDVYGALTQVLNLFVYSHHIIVNRAIVNRK